VEPLRTVDAQADQEIVLLQESAPFVVKEQAICLQVVLTAHVRGHVFLLQDDDFPKEVQPHEGRLSSLPGEDHLLVILPFDVLAYVCLKHLV